VKNGAAGSGERPVTFRGLDGEPLRGVGPLRPDRPGGRFFGDTVLPCPKMSVEL